MPEMPFADAKVHSELAIARLWRGFRVDRFLQRGVRFSIGVTGGLLDGLTSKCHARSCYVGADIESGIVLFDEGIADQHVELTFKSSIFGAVMSVRALAPGVSVNDHLIETGKSTSFGALPQTVLVKDIALEIQPHDTSQKAPNPIVVKAWRYGRHPILLVLSLLLVSQLFGFGTSEFRIALTPEELPFDVVQREDMNTARLASVTKSVQAKLTELGLEDYVTASLDTSGAVGITGTLRSDKEVAWKEFQFWYDQSDAPVLLSRVTMAPDLSDFPPIASIKLTEPRMINLLNGTQLRVGDIIHEQVRLKAINSDSLVLDTQGDDLVILFSGGDVIGG